jgi:hypothetical protein
MAKIFHLLDNKLSKDPVPALLSHGGNNMECCLGLLGGCGCMVESDRQIQKLA